MMICLMLFQQLQQHLPPLFWFHVGFPSEGFTVRVTSSAPRLVLLTVPFVVLHVAP